MEDTFVRVWNNGRGIPVYKDTKHGVFIPQLIFGFLLSGSNFDDSQKRITGGRNGYGAKLANIFSERFLVETVDAKRKLHYKQEWSKNMSVCKPPKIKPVKDSRRPFTCITFYPDFTRFNTHPDFGEKMTKFDAAHRAWVLRRCWDLAGTTTLRVLHNHDRIPIRSFQDYTKAVAWHTNELLVIDFSQFYLSIGKADLAEALVANGFKKPTDVQG